MRQLSAVLLRLAVVAALAACSDPAAPLPGSPAHPLVTVSATLSRSVLRPGDTTTFGYSLENRTADTLHLTWATGCQLLPVLAQREGRRMTPPPLGNVFCTMGGGGVTLLPRARQTGTFLVLRGHDPAAPAVEQRPGYLLTPGTFEAAVVLYGAELGRPVRSAGLRLQVR